MVGTVVPGIKYNTVPVRTLVVYGGIEDDFIV